MLGITELTYTALIAFLIVIIIGPIFIPMLRKFKFGQTVRDDGPQTHLAKNGTPTMGGIIMIVAILITGLTRVKVSHDMAVGLICIAGFGFIGFLDDFIKIKLKRSLGLKAYQKIILQLHYLFMLLFISIHHHQVLHNL
uniref:Phospho-N-acetylmuramoyl-pentapeptide-transferase n=1 Tax=Clostridioides difficile TaxID=1496 RepID=A0A381IDF8_CLODI|nr:phospho-N-acetylmuramoyl-pentapeptide-transferase [Clostridioides difficile]